MFLDRVLLQYINTMASILPYQYEPESEEETDEVVQPATQLNQRIDQDVSQW